MWSCAPASNIRTNAGKPPSGPRVPCRPCAGRGTNRGSAPRFGGHPGGLAARGRAWESGSGRRIELIRGHVFWSVGGFPRHRGAEDLILVERERLRAAGAPMAYAPNALVRWRLARSSSATYRLLPLASVTTSSREAILAPACRPARRRAHVRSGRLPPPGGWRLGVLAFVLVARAGQAGWAKHGSFTFSTLHPGRILGAAGILAAIDVATAVGLVRRLRRKERS